jgi:hypothetical protein
MVTYGTHLLYLCYNFLLKKKQSLSVQEIVKEMMPELETRTERINAQNRVRRSLEQLVFEQKLLKEQHHSFGNISVYKYSIYSYESEHVESGN